MTSGYCIGGLMTPKYKAYAFSALGVCIGSANSVIATDATLFALKRCSNVTTSYVYKNVIGQTVGLALNLLFKRQIKGNEYGIAALSICASQLAYNLDIFLYRQPQRYLVYKSISGCIQNVNWILIGAVNSRVMMHLCDSSTDISEIFSEISVANTIGSSLGLVTGAFLVKKLSNCALRTKIGLSYAMCIAQILSNAQLIKVVFE